MTLSSQWMFAPTGTSKRSRIENNLTNFCISRPVHTSCIQPTPYRARGLAMLSSLETQAVPHSLLQVVNAALE